MQYVLSHLAVEHYFILLDENFKKKWHIRGLIRGRAYNWHMKN